MRDPSNNAHHLKRQTTNRPGLSVPTPLLPSLGIN